MCISVRVAVADAFYNCIVPVILLNIIGLMKKGTLIKTDDGCNLYLPEIAILIKLPVAADTILDSWGC